MKKSNLFIVIFVLSSWFSYSQDLNPNIIPPSPDAANLGKYVDIPVSLYSGTPSVSIPIWNVKAKDISIPISLDYHASGVKVDDIASSVGLG